MHFCFNSLVFHPPFSSQHLTLSAPTASVAAFLLPLCRDNGPYITSGRILRLSTRFFILRTMTFITNLWLMIGFNGCNSVEPLSTPFYIYTYHRLYQVWAGVSRDDLQVSCWNLWICVRHLNSQLCMCVTRTMLKWTCWRNRKVILLLCCRLFTAIWSFFIK